MSLLESARAGHAAGLCVLPAIPADKRPALTSWKAFQRTVPSDAQIEAWFAQATGICIVCGKVSGNLEMLDFDNKGELFSAWRERIQEKHAGLFERLVVKQTPSGGFHVAYRCEQEIPGNQKLALRQISYDTPEVREINGKSYKPVKRGDRWEVRLVLIETRGEGGLFLCAPTPGYRLIQGEFSGLPVLTQQERDVLIAAARSLDESAATGDASSSTTASSDVNRPGDAFNASADIRPLLIQHGWTQIREGENEHWRRPGKDTGTSATLKDGVFYVFSTNAAPFDGDKGYSPFQVYALLEHNGDFNAAARKLREDGYGEDSPSDVDLSAFLSHLPDPPGTTDEADCAARPLCELFETVTDLDPPIIHGLLREGETMNVIAAPKFGKALAIDTPMFTDSGWLTMGDLQPGMKVHTHDGSLTEIVAVSDVLYGRPCYHVQTKSGAWVIADENHQWLVCQRNHQEIVTTGQLAAGHRGRRWLLPIAGAVQREEATLPFDPWLLGYWLGNGTSREGSVTINKHDLSEFLRIISALNYRFGKIRPKRGSAILTVFGLKAMLREMNLLRCKHIPELYLTASHHQRAELLAGLLDSDGHAVTLKNGTDGVEFSTGNQRLFFQTLILIRSLGIKPSIHVDRARIYGRDCGHNLRIEFIASRQTSPFRFSRRTLALPGRLPCQRTRRDAIESVTPVASVPVRCIQVAHPSGLYLAGHDLMVTHNSWLVMRLAISIASGLDWFGMQVEHGRVLHIDNELRLKTIVHRYRTVAEALNVPHHLFSRNLDVKSLRGQLKDLNQLGEFFKKLEPNRYKAVVIDAFYRTLPVGTDENDNGAIANLYNKLDWYASRLKCAFILIHHSSKGNQAFKSVTDVGAGAGAQSRAADTHLILRAHEQPNVAVVEAAVRSWPPREPMCIRWEFPLWQPAQECDPYQLHGKVAESPAPKQEWTVDRFIAECVMPFDPCSQNKIAYEANQLGMTAYKARELLKYALNEELLYKERVGTHTLYVAAREGINPGKSLLVAAVLEKTDAPSSSSIAERFGVSDRYVRQIRNEGKHDTPNDNTTQAESM